MSMNKSSNPRVAIFGVGPSGLVAAHAAVRNGCTVDFYSEHMKKSKLYGCQYLHDTLPGIGQAIGSTRVKYSLTGTADDYRAKVYGEAWDGKVSPEDFIGNHWAWDLRATYDILFDAYISETSWFHTEFDGRVTQFLLPGMQMNYDLVFSSIPKTHTCIDLKHKFAGLEIWAAGDAPDLGIEIPIRVAKNTIECNGLREPSWYRASNVFGMSTVEWSKAIPKPPVDNIATVTKPLWNDCDCFPELIRIGRYGAWQKDILVHNVYNTVAGRIAAWRDIRSS